MYQDLKQHFWWRSMKKDIAEYVSKCLVCQQVKAPRQKTAGLLQPLSIPEWKWENIAMDFIVGLPKTLKGYTVIWVVVDRLTKSAHFLPERKVIGKTHRQPGEEDEVRPEVQIPKPEPNPITLGQPSTRRFLRPSRFSPKRVSPVTAKPDSLDLRPASPVQRRHVQPNPPEFILQSGWPVSRERPETRERSDNPRLDPRPLHTRLPLIVTRGTFAARLPLTTTSRLRRLIRLGKPISSPFVTVPTLPNLVSALFKEPIINGSIERSRGARSLHYILGSTSAKAYQIRARHPCDIDGSIVHPGTMAHA
ncbi:uncharacterized protein LOC111489925 [Cucurbita maxima]|uniref:Uncharacterized protein LOC111489925 n=1 Tax=Cucurbita maxima TaxID=3661 RepID=A0A6J1JUR9_CUCMA|nr:uncharacterized protein LOC111489925 [Cucurbita maxima]